MPAKLSINEVKGRVETVHNGIVSLDETTYINTGTKCRFIDRDYGEWFITPNNVLNGHGHPKRKNEVRKKTCLKKYGTEHPLQNKEIFDKVSKTNLGRYGVSNVSQTKEVKERVRKTFYNNYVTNNIFGMEEIRQKIKETCLKRYGFESPLRNSTVQERRRKTSLERFGVPSPSQSELVKAKVRKSWNKLDRADIIKKRGQTNLKKYGFICSLQNKEVGLRAARSANNSCVLKHWKTGEELICVGSYEVKVINYLNENQVEYSWQPKVFKIPTDGGKTRTYRPDLYLDDGQLWIEIKGYFRKDAQDKWDWFHLTHKNSELWDKIKLKELNIL